MATGCRCDSAIATRGLLAPNGYIYAAPGQKHYGAFYGKGVYLEQDSEFHYRPFNAPLPLQ